MSMRPEGLTGLAVRAANLVERELTTLAPVWPELERRSTRVLTTTSGMTRLSPSRDFPSSLFTTAGEAGLFRRLAVGQDLRLFRAPWSEALLWHFNRLLDEDGELLLPFTPDDRAERDGKMSRGDLERLFGKEGELVAERMIRMARSDALTPAPSVLRWFLDDPLGVVHQQMLVRNDPSALRASLIDPLADEFVVAGLDRVAIRHPEPVR